jgi:hypothetical protein
VILDAERQAKMQGSERLNPLPTSRAGRFGVDSGNGFREDDLIRHRAECVFPCPEVRALPFTDLWRYAGVNSLLSEDEATYAST